jgi:hypothetical protein
MPRHASTALGPKPRDALVHFMWCADRERIRMSDETHVSYEQRSSAGGASFTPFPSPCPNRAGVVTAPVQSGKHNLTTQQVDSLLGTTAVYSSAKEAPPIQNACSEGVPRAARAATLLPRNVTDGGHPSHLVRGCGISTVRHRIPQPLEYNLLQTL